MNEKQLNRIYGMVHNIDSEIRTDQTGSNDIRDALEEFKNVVVEELRSLVWGEYYTTELQKYDT